jgi:hypothetical protein
LQRKELDSCGRQRKTAGDGARASVPPSGRERSIFIVKTTIIEKTDFIKKGEPFAIERFTFIIGVGKEKNFIHSSTSLY